MSLFLDILKESHEAILPLHGDVLVLGDDLGTPIKGILNVGIQLNQEFELGNDPREESTFDVVQPVPKGTFGGDERAVDANDYLFQGDRRSRSRPKWFVVRREDNPADFTIRFWLRKIVQGKDD